MLAVCLQEIEVCHQLSLPLQDTTALLLDLLELGASYFHTVAGFTPIYTRISIYDNARNVVPRTGSRDRFQSCMCTQAHQRTPEDI